MKSPSRALGALCLALTLVAPSGQAQTAPGSAGEPAPEVRAALALSPDAARGKAAFDDCSGCHRKDAAGRPGSNTPRLSGQHASVIVKQILDIRSGLRANPPMKPWVESSVLSLQAVADIAGYLQGLPVAGNIVKGPGTALARGQQLYEQQCVACHGTAGEGNPALFAPMLASQHFGYLRRELGLIRDGGRGNSNPTMAALLQAYGPADLDALADHLSRLPPPAPR